MSRDPNWSCEWCGKRYYRSPTEIKRERSRCCSRRCGAMARSRAPITARFWQYVAKGDGCWLWTGAANHADRGVIGESFDGTQKSHLAHRISYSMHKGEIPEGGEIRQSCDNPRCVNPDHLFLKGTDPAPEPPR